MKTFTDLHFSRESFSIGYMDRARIFFNNGYGISVVIGTFSYGGDEGLYECAVLKGNKHESEICYDTPITHDVIGYCTPERVTEIMKEIQNLKNEI